MLRGGIFAVVSLLAVTTAINVSAGRPGRPQVASSSGRAGDLGARPQLLSHPQAIQYTTEALKDRVDSLPGWGPINGFNMFSGYIVVDEVKGRALFYIYVESARNPQEDPLVLWLNGGPGCSSLGGGFMSELGPWYPRQDGRTLEVNPNSWNRIANVLFLESPAFVGFSYSNSSEDRIVGDGRTAADSRLFLLGFLQRFPHLLEKDLYLSGESYAGHYVPNLAAEIIRGNKEEGPQLVAASASASSLFPPPIHLKGILVGNPLTDVAMDNTGAIDFWYNHALISQETAEGIKSTCDLSRIGPLDQQVSSEGLEGEEQAALRSKERLCDEFCDRAAAEMGPINIYEIYADVCVPSSNRARSEAAAMIQALSHPPLTSSPSGPGREGTRSLGGVLGLRLTLGTLRGPGLEGIQTTTTTTESATGAHPTLTTTSTTSLSRRHLLAAAAAAGSTPSGTTTTSSSSLTEEPGYDPCVDDEVEDYLNLPEVQRALHANQTVILPYRWTDCTSLIRYSREDLLASMLPTYESLLVDSPSPSSATLQEPPIRILVYSGDVDGILPVTGTRAWVSSLGLKMTRAWRPWFSPHQPGQVGGYAVDYQGLSLATVRGAGHMVPYVEPERMFHLLSEFLEKRSL